MFYTQSKSERTARFVHQYYSQFFSKSRLDLVHYFAVALIFQGFDHKKILNFHKKSVCYVSANKKPLLKPYAIRSLPRSINLVSNFSNS